MILNNIVHIIFIICTNNYKTSTQTYRFLNFWVMLLNILVMNSGLWDFIISLNNNVVVRTDMF